MLRYLITICELFAGICALVSPVAIIHWLMKATKMPVFNPVVDLLEPFFLPLNALLEMVLPLPDFQFQGHVVPATQGVLACLMTVVFFVLHFCAESLKAADEKLDITRQALVQKRRLQKVREEARREEKKNTANRRIFLKVVYDVDACPQAAPYFENTYESCGGKLIERLSDQASYEFDTVEHAFRYVLDASRAVTSYYLTLRPMDPQPPYRVGIEALPEDCAQKEGVAMASAILRYTADNQILFSENVLSLLRGSALENEYKYQSQGIYTLAGSSQEVYRLLDKRHRQAV